MLTDAELVNLVRAGDHLAFAELVGRYERAVWTRVWHVVGNYHAAQDATQDTFLEAFRSLGQLRRPESFGLWLMRTAHREALRTARRMRRTATFDDAPAEMAVAAPCDDLTEDSARLLSSVGGLPDHERTVVALRYFDGYSVAKIARLTHRPVGTVTKQLSRALERLRSVLREVNT
ncbi:MAG TPA: sigma-70 family RNA polymerase sigma factor [Pirellulales bacterium]|nr:sigma-70 family RNA polymerase sigma factor [Pirellulales bacterium]